METPILKLPENHRRVPNAPLYCPFTVRNRLVPVSSYIPGFGYASTGVGMPGLLRQFRDLTSSNGFSCYDFCRNLLTEPLAGRPNCDGRYHEVS